MKKTSEELWLLLIRFKVSWSSRDNDRYNHNIDYLGMCSILQYFIIYIKISLNRWFSWLVNSIPVGGEQGVLERCHQIQQDGVQKHCQAKTPCATTNQRNVHNKSWALKNMDSADRPHLIKKLGYLTPGECFERHSVGFNVLVLKFPL